MTHGGTQTRRVKDIARETEYLGKGKTLEIFDFGYGLFSIFKLRMKETSEAYKFHALSQYILLWCSGSCAVHLRVGRVGKIFPFAFSFLGKFRETVIQAKYKHLKSPRQNRLKFHGFL